ncbi:MAG: prepilin-type N-terminal cleavage/methylation domain-containing protein [Phycisphaerae bacterium]
MKQGSCRAFTLIELLVVIGIIAALAATLLVTLSGAWKRAKATQSMNTLREWGNATAIFGSENKGRLPVAGGLRPPGPVIASAGVPGMPSAPSGPVAISSFGEQGTSGLTNRRVGWEDPDAWFNCLPPLLGAEPMVYVQQEQSSLRSISISMFSYNDYEHTSLWVDPLASPPAPAAGGEEIFPGWFYIRMARSYADQTTEVRPWFSSYTWNSAVNRQPDNARYQEQPWRTSDYATKAAHLKVASDSVLMTEIRATPGELAGTLFENDEVGSWRRWPVDDVRGDFGTFTARHNGGGHILFADGSVRWYAYNAIAHPRQQRVDFRESPDFNTGTPGVRWAANGEARMDLSKLR